jgi:glutamine amidotransferase
MCELFALSSRIPTVTTFSLAAFARRGGRNTRMVDGWGLAFYDERDVRLFKEPEPAGDSAWLDFIQKRRVSARLLLSHIRHATQGSISLANTQPFARELGGRMHVFAHNGRLDGIESRHAGEWNRVQPIGDTDSEIAFCILLEHISHLQRDRALAPLEARLSVVRRFAADLRTLGPANFLYSDGDVLFAHAHRRMQADCTIAPPGLWRLDRRCPADVDALPQAGVTIEAHGPHQEITLLASVPLTDEPWAPLAEGEIIVVKDGEAIDQVGPRLIAASTV